VICSSSCASCAQIEESVPLNQFVEHGLELDVRVAGNACGIRAGAEFRVRGSIDLHHLIVERGAFDPGVVVAGRAADPHLDGRVAGGNLRRDPS